MQSKTEFCKLAIEVTQLDLVRKGRKWLIEENGKGWIFNKQVSTK